ncbi:MAG: transglutaminase domain-containing protein [Eubacteriales bacterium]|nr:transglutaminase domain-containing protein [Eubacteriales bacterium]
MRGKKCIKGMLAALVLCLALGAPIQAAAAQTTAAATAQKAGYTGWKTVSGKKYYYVNGKKLTSTFKTIGGKRYYFASKGVMYTGWLTKNGKKYYFTKSGKNKGVMYTGLQTISKKKYYFDKNGVMKTGFQKVNGNTYYFNKKSGAMYIGWLTQGNKKYYFVKTGSKQGIMRTGLTQIGSKKYYFNSKGVMQTGMKTINGATYYFNKGGTMHSGWKTVGTKKYYFSTAKKNKGQMLTGWQTISKKKYYFTPSGTKKGVMHTGWLTIGSKKYYLASNGVMATGWVTIGTKQYYFKSTGVLDASKTKNATSALDQKCASIIKQLGITNSSRDVKLQKIFQYVTWQFSYRTVAFSGNTGWYKTMGYNMLTSGSGNCYSYAAAFACLVKKATNLPVRVCWGSTPGAYVAWTPHGWCEVKINGTWYVFDPDLEREVYNGNGTCYYKPASSYYGWLYANIKYDTVTSL